MNKDIGLGIIGLAAGADLLAINADHESRLRVVAICDSNAAAARAAGDRHQIPFVTTDPVDLLSQPGVDAVAVCGAVGERYGHCMAALSAGKRALCGVPMAASLEDARNLAQESERLGGLLMAANPHRWETRFATARALAASGELGDLHFIRSHVASGQRGSIDPWHLCAPLDLLRWVAGEIEEVHAVASPAAVTVNARFASGAVGSALALAGPLPRSVADLGLALHGSGGSIVDGQAVLSRLPGSPSMTIEAVDSSSNRDMLGCVREFEARLPAGGDPGFDPWDGVRSVAACAAVLESLRTGAPASVSRTGTGKETEAHG